MSNDKQSWFSKLFGKKTHKTTVRAPGKKESLPESGNQEPHLGKTQIETKGPLKKKEISPNNPIPAAQSSDSQGMEADVQNGYPSVEEAIVSGISEREKEQIESEKHHADLEVKNLFDWKPGDVILDLYEVCTVREGDQEKDFHAAGAMGKVYRVHHKNLGIDLAVKVPRPEQFHTSWQKENFIRECETWINLGLHPNTVSCFYVREIDGVPCVFAEYIEGGSLKDWIYSRKLYEGGKQQALKRMLDIAIQFAWGLHYAHEQGLIHQDVKPSNVMMTPDGTTKVTDFGLAKAKAIPKSDMLPGVNQTIFASWGGMTPAYCSPEQAEIANQWDVGLDPESILKLTRRTDLWSWAVSVFEMFNGGLTWQAGQIVNHSFESYVESGSENDHIPRMPEEMVELLRRCFKTNPDDRPHDMNDTAEVLKEIYISHFNQSYSRPKPKAAANSADSLNNRAVSMFDLGKREEAARLWSETIHLDPMHETANYNLGVFQWRTARITDDEVLHRLARVGRDKPGNRADYLTGLIHLERLDIDSALKIIKQAMEKDSSLEVGSSLEQANRLISQQPSCVLTFEGHAEEIKSVCLDADGRWALSGSWDKTLRLWDVATGKCIRIFEGHSSMVESVCLSIDGRWALSGSRDKTLRLWEVASGECLQTFTGHSSYVLTVCLSKDARWALSGSEDKTLRLWEVATGQCIKTFQGHAESVLSACLSADGSFALSGGQDTTLRLWEVTTGRCIRTFEGHFDMVESVHLSQDGRWALSGSRDKTMRMWDVSTGKCVRTFIGHLKAIGSACLSEDGCWALSGSWDATLRLWEVKTGQCVRTFEGHENLVVSVFLSADMRRALSGSWDNTLRLWDLSLDQFSHRPSGHLQLSPIISSQAAEQSEATFSSILQAGQRALQEGRIHDAMIALLEARGVKSYERDHRLLDLWHKLSFHGTRIGLRDVWLRQQLTGHAKEVRSACLSADGRWALSGSWDKTVRLWDIATGQCIRTFEGHKEGVNSVILSEDGRRALSGSLDHTVRLWDVATGRCIRSFEGHLGWVNSVCLHADVRWALSGSQDTTLRLWDVRTGRCVRTFEGHRGGVNSVCLSEDGRLILSGSAQDWSLRLWEVETGTCVQTLRTPGARSACLSADGHWAVSKDLRVWDVATGQIVRTFQCESSTSVNSICLSADGHWALAGGGLIRGVLWLWKVGTGQCVRTFEGHTHPINSVCFGANERWVLSASDDCTLQVWELDWELEVNEKKVN